MIYCEDLNFIYIAVSKTASRSIHTFLEDAFGAIDTKKGQHTHHDSSVLPGYFVFASARNPYSRMVSLWAHIQKKTKGAWTKHEMYGLPFDEFTKRAHEKGREWHQLQVDGCNFSTVHQVVRFETLLEDMKALPFMKEGDLSKFPFVGKGPHDEWRGYYKDDGIIRNVYEWAKTDFDTLGYSDDPGVENAIRPAVLNPTMP